MRKGENIVKENENNITAMLEKQITELHKRCNKEKDVKKVCALNKELCRVVKVYLTIPYLRLRA